MKKMITSILIASGITSSVYAGCAGNACLNVDVEKIVVTTSTIFIATSGTETALSCTPSAGVFTTLSATEASSKAMYSALLTAQTTKRKVKIRIVNGSPTCKISYVEL